MEKVFVGTFCPLEDLPTTCLCFRHINFLSMENIQFFILRKHTIIPGLRRYHTVLYEVSFEIRR